MWVAAHSRRGEIILSVGEIDAAFERQVLDASGQQLLKPDTARQAVFNRQDG